MGEPLNMNKRAFWMVDRMSGIGSDKLSIDIFADNLTTYLRFSLGLSVVTVFLIGYYSIQSRTIGQ